VRSSEDKILIKPCGNLKDVFVRRLDKEFSNENWKDEHWTTFCESCAHNEFDGTHRRKQWTWCLVSVTQDSLTTTSLRSCTMTYTGSMWQIESDINWVSSAWQGSLRGTSSTVAQRSGNVSGQPHINRWWCHDTGCPLLVAEHSLCRVWQSGTLCPMTSVHSSTMCPSNGAWKRGCSLVTSVHSAL